MVVFEASAGPALSRQSSGQLGLSAAAGSEGVGSGGLSCAWRPPPGCTIGAAAVAEAAVLAFCTGAARQLCVLLPSCGGGSQPEQQAEAPLPRLVHAGQLPTGAEVSCASNLLLPGRLQGPGPLRCCVFAVGTYASQVLLVQLRWDPQQPQHASLAVLRRIDLTATSLAGSLTGGAAAAAAAAASPLSPRSFQREQLTPESLLLILPASDDCGSCDTVELLAASAASLVVGLRTGSILQLTCSLDGRGPGHEELLALSLGHMPAVLLPLPTPGGTSAAAAPPSAAVLSDRVSLLHCAHAAGRAQCQQLGQAQVQAAAPLLLDGGGLASSSFMLDAAAAEPAQQDQRQGQQQLFLLCATTDGCLRLVALDAPQLSHIRSWPLPNRLQPSALAVHAASGCVAVAGCAPPSQPLRCHAASDWQDGDELEDAGLVVLVDPSTGECRPGWPAHLRCSIPSAHPDASPACRGWGLGLGARDSGLVVRPRCSMHSNAAPRLSCPLAG